MRKEIKESFRGLINGVEFDDKNVFLAMEYFLENVEERYGEIYNSRFIEDVRDFIFNLWQSSGDLDWGEIESELYFSVTNSDRFEEMDVSILGKSWEDLTTKLINGEYTLEGGVL